MSDATTFFPTPTSREIAERMGRPELAREISQADLQALDALTIRRERRVSDMTIDELMEVWTAEEKVRADQEAAAFWARFARNGRRSDNDNAPRGAA